MPRSLLPTAVVIAIVAVGGAVWFGLIGRSGGVAAPSSVASSTVATASPGSSVAAVASASAAAAELAIGSPYPTTASIIRAGSAYHSVGFLAPLAFTMPTYRAPTVTDFNAETWADGRTMRIFWDPDHAVTIHDGINISNDFCAPTRVTPIPTTAAAVRSWLAAMHGVTVTARPSLTTADGRAVASFDVAVGSGGSGCYGSSSPPPGSPPIWFSAGERHRIYAIPVNGRTVLVITFGSTGDIDPTNAMADTLVSSLRFG
jgi:hypothetical protein